MRGSKESGSDEDDRGRRERELVRRRMEKKEREGEREVVRRRMERKEGER